MVTRPHILSWTPVSEPVMDENGYYVEGPVLEEISVPCRFHSGGDKQFRNEDKVVIQQKGRIRVDVGSPMPAVMQEVTVTEGDYIHFKGTVMEVYRGQIAGWRCDV